MTDEDAPFIVDLLNDPAFLRYIGDKKVRTLEDARRYIVEGPIASYARFGFGLDVVTLKADKHADRHLRPAEARALAGSRHRLRLPRRYCGRRLRSRGGGRVPGSRARAGPGDHVAGQPGVDPAAREARLPVRAAHCPVRGCAGREAVRSHHRSSLVIPRLERPANQAVTMTKPASLAILAVLLCGVLSAAQERTPQSVADELLAADRAFSAASAKTDLVPASPRCSPTTSR